MFVLQKRLENLTFVNKNKKELRSKKKKTKVTLTKEDIKEMALRLSIPYDVVSDEKMTFIKLMNLPTFIIENKTYIKRITMIVEKSIIKHVFYPIFPPDLHVKDVIHWLEKN